MLPMLSFPCKWESMLLVFLILSAGPPSCVTAAEPDSLRWYAGDTHIHTAIHAVSSIAERVDEGLVGGLDWLAITRHKRSGAFWKADEVDSASVKYVPRIVPILGMEWDEPPQLGDEDVVILGVNPHAPIPDDSLQAIIDWANAEGGVFIFAHPSPFVFQNIHRWHGYTAFEGYSGPAWNAACEPGGAWDGLLNAGSRLFIVGGSDNHDQKALGQRVKTYVLARSNRPQDILDAIRAGRAYVSQRGLIRLDFRVNNRMMGEAVSLSQPDVVVTISAQAKVPLTRIRLIGDGRELWSATPNTPSFETQLHLLILSDIRYIRPIVETKDTKTMGNPVFLARSGEPVRAAAVPDTANALYHWHRLVDVGKSLAGTERAALTRLLAHPNPTARLYAAYALIERHDPQLMSILTSLAADSIPRVRAYATRMLAGRAGAEDLPFLRQLMRDQAPEVRLWAVRALERSGAPGTKTILIDMVDDPDGWVHFAAMEGLLDLAKQDSTVFDDLTARVRAGQLSAAEGFRWAGAVSRNTIITLLRERSAQGTISQKDLYLALEQLGASPAAAYQLISRRTSVPPVLDGLINDPAWRNEAVPLVQDDMADTRPSETRALVSYDDRAVYVAVVCSTAGIAPLDGRDVEYVTLAFDTNDNGSIDYSFEIDRDGRVFGWKDGVEDWPKPLSAKIAERKGRWSVEVAIPYTTLERGGPAANEVWGFNIGHGVRGRNARLTSWAPTLGQPSNARRYGKLVFGE